MGGEGAHKNARKIRLKLREKSIGSTREEELDASELKKILLISYQRLTTVFQYFVYCCFFLHFLKREEIISHFQDIIEER